MKHRVITFRALVEREYLAKGIPKLGAFSIIYLATRVSIGSQRAAYNGTRVLPETANPLAVWAAATHGAELDRDAMLRAPQKSTPPSERACSEDVLRRLSIVSLEHVPANDAERRFHVVLAGDSGDDLHHVETALRSALAGGR